MSRQRNAPLAAAIAALALGGSLAPTNGFGQAALPPPGPAAAASPAFNPDDVNRLGESLAKQLTRIAREVGGIQDEKKAAQVRGLSENARELAESVNEFRQAMARSNDRFSLRQSFAGIDAGVQQLLGELTQAGFANASITEAAGQVAETDGRIRQAVGLNDYTPDYYRANQPLEGVADLKRLAHALVDRSVALAAVVRTEMPQAVRSVRDAANLARVCDDFHDALFLHNKLDTSIQNGFAGVSAETRGLADDFAGNPPPPRVLAAWQSFRSVEVLVRQGLGLPNTDANLAGTVLAPIAAGNAPPIAGLAEQLVEQSGAFVQAFSGNGTNVPESNVLLADAQALQAASANFRQDAARGLDPARLAFRFRDVDATWQRLSRRTNRIARGKTGPNIQQVAKMGQTVAEIHRLLGMPGYPPTFTANP